MMDDRCRAPATLRNRGPILNLLRAVLPETGVVLEIASGSGEHVVYFGQHLPSLTFQPTDISAAALLSISAWVRSVGLANVRDPFTLDANADWPMIVADAIVCINMIHIAPWSATVGLMRGAGLTLASGAPLYLYGPFRQNGVHSAPSNEEFDRSLRLSDPSWGVRNLEEVVAEARFAGFSDPTVSSMPANNLSVVLRKV
jgi:hypothetical protein